MTTAPFGGVTAEDKEFWLYEADEGGYKVSLSRKDIACLGPDRLAMLELAGKVSPDLNIWDYDIENLKAFWNLFLEGKV